MNPITLGLRIVVLLVGVWLLFEGVASFTAPSGGPLDLSQHIISGLAFLAGGLVLMVLAVAPQRIGEVFRFIVTLGRG